MSNKEIVFIVYVSDIKTSTSFYTDLLEVKTSFESPRYVTMDLAPGVSLALWTGKSDALDSATARTSEVCLNLGGGEEAILSTYDQWVKKGVSIVEEPHSDVFGTTFVASDLDGNRIRVAPID
ncbi:VOC family protein [Corynebacterium callunae]|uniref:VOC family protein n=1 Tax=Corynebacterium callunae TaxID=1721 RepID=UPI003981C882